MEPLSLLKITRSCHSDDSVTMVTWALLRFVCNSIPEVEGLQGLIRPAFAPEIPNP